MAGNQLTEGFQEKGKHLKKEKCSYSIFLKFKTFVWASMNILVNMSVMRRSSVPESILQNKQVSVLYQNKL